MPFKRAVRGVKRWAKKRYGRKGGLVRLAKDVSYLKSIVNVERKFIDLAASSYALSASTTGALLLLNGVGQGLNLTDRVGDSILLKSCYIEGFVQLSGVATQDMVRLQIVLDKQPNATSAAWGDVYESTLPACTALRNKLTTDRFKVITERKITINNNGDQLVKFKMYVPFKRLHTKYSNTGATISSVYTNALYFSLAGNLTTNTSVVAFTARVRFIDN